ncbi:serine threonine- kinase N2 isoform X2 [Pelobates cultripes]|uniref:protein kinase C n=1 Tax=Pelobates cultripes TaxID=61616 RepID=A0AAD1TJX8_PELCU|nr:serine threonine- kinase N2 isoform X2 [Pelobates cultripes]
MVTVWVFVVSGTQVIDVIEQGAGEHPDGPQIPVASDNDSCSSPDEDKLATFEKQLEDEYKVKSKAEKLKKAYSTGRSKDQKHLSDAQKILHDSKIKTEILRMLILQHKATPAISPLEKRIEELSHQFVIERAVAEGAKHAIQKLDGKPLVEAQSILQASNEKLDLLKYSLEERVKELPDGHPRKSITTEELSLGSVKSKSIALTGTLKVRVKGCHGILENVPGRLKDPSDVLPGRSPRRGRFLLMNRIRRNNRGSNQKIQENFDFSSTVILILLIPLCCAKTRLQDGTSLIQCAKTRLQHWTTLIQCAKTRLQHGTSLIQCAKTRLQHGTSLIQCAKTRLQDGTSLIQCAKTRLQDGTSLIQCAKTRLQDGEVRTQLKIDHIPVGSTSWKTVSNPSWNKTFKLDLDKSRELEISLYWHDQRSLCATKTLKLEEFLLNPKQKLCLQLEPQGTLFIKVTFSSPFIQKRPKLQTIRKLISTKQEETTEPAPLENAAIDAHSLSVSDTESVESSAPTLDPETEKTIQPAPEEDVVTDSPILLVATESMHPLTPDACTITEETFQQPLVEATKIDNVPVVDPEIVESSPPAINAIAAEIIQPLPEEARIIDNAPLPVEDSASMEPSPQAIVSLLEMTIQPAVEEDLVTDTTPLPVKDTDSVEPCMPAVNEITEKTIQPPPEEDAAINAHSLPVEDSESVEPLRPAVKDMEKIIQPAPEEAVVIDTPQVPAVDNEKVESSPPAAATDMENNIQTPNEKDAVIDVDNIVEETIEPPKGLVCDTVPLAEADVEKPSSSAGIQQGARLSIQDFDCLCVLGRGAFGKVLLVDDKRTNIKFALKAQKKQDITGTIRVPRSVLCGMLCARPGILASKRYCSQLLNKDPEDRLGASENGAWDLKSHPFFEQIDWFALLFKSVRPPCIPSIEGPDDIRNFNTIYTSCVPILTPPDKSKSLSDVELELFKDFDWVSDRI